MFKLWLCDALRVIKTQIQDCGNWCAKIPQNRKEKKKNLTFFFFNFFFERVDSTGVVTPLKTSRERTRSLYQTHTTQA